MRKAITKRSVDAMRPGEALADDEVRRFYARCLPSGVATYGFRYRDRSTGQRRWLSLGLHGQLTPQQAREIAQKHAGAVADGKDPLAVKAASRAAASAARANPEKTVADVLDDHMREYALVLTPRSAHEKGRIFEKYIKPVLGERPVRELARPEIVSMLNKMVEKNGRVMADRTLAHFRKALTWHAIRDDLFNSPIVKGMALIRPQDIERDRVLKDDEIRSLWDALDTLRGSYPIVIRLLLLTAQRVNTLLSIREDEIEDDVWSVPASRDKSKRKQEVPLTPRILAILDQLPKPRDEGFYFTTNHKVPLAYSSKFKLSLDAAIAKSREKNGLRKMPPWRIHDLRRTARTLMSRAGVRPDISELVLGHTVKGIKKTYDHYEFREEKRAALSKLASLLDDIFHPPAANVVMMSSRAP